MGNILQGGLSIGGVQYCIYGDEAYLIRPWMQVAFPTRLEGEVDAEEEAQNTDMARVRLSVEWRYKEVKQIFTSLDFRRKLKVREGPVALVYRCAALPWSVRTRLYGNHIATSFRCDPPDLERYLNLP